MNQNKIRTVAAYYQVDAIRLALMAGRSAMWLEAELDGQLEALMAGHGDHQMLALVTAAREIKGL
jgi:hypothetical protein